MTKTTKKVLIVSSIFIVGYVIYKKNKNKNAMISDNSGSGLFGMGILGIL